MQSSRATLSGFVNEFRSLSLEILSPFVWLATHQISCLITHASNELWLPQPCANRSQLAGIATITIYKDKDPTK